MKKRIIPLVLVFLLLAGCGHGEEVASVSSQEVPSTSREVFAMDTYMTITCYGDRCEEAARAAEEEILRLDALLSIGSETSEISAINTNGGGTLSAESRAMVEQSLVLYEQTGGAFDITVYPLMQLWGFTSDEFAVPDSQELAQTLEKTGSEKLAYADGVLDLGNAAGIDLGGIAKGYTSGRLMEIFEEYDLTAGLVSLGGNVQCYGTKPNGSPWRCGIQDPYAADGGSTLMGILEVADQAVITSGAYERYFEGDDGVLYHHILDPETGMPADSGLISVTIVSDSGMLADGLSTACYVMGLDKAAEYWRAHSGEFDMILMNEDGEVYVTAPLAERFTTEYPLYIIEEGKV